jgi:peptidoglycan hydrolase-like protein with peptidoglycan-binding domain
MSRDRCAVRRIAVWITALLLLGAPTAAYATEEPAHEFGEMVDYPLVFPVGGDATTGTRSTFWDSRADGTHHAQDILAPKLTPLYAVADGTVEWVNWSRDPEDLNPERCCSLVIAHDDGWETWYLHLNNDTPGTDDGLTWGFAPDIAPGVRVAAGQLIGYVGDSGNCDTMAGCPPHLHFELRDPQGQIVDAYEALRAAEGLVEPCAPASLSPLASLLAGTGLLRLGSTGPAVWELQGFLRLRGFDPGPIDGTFSTYTDQAVRLFQERWGLEVDGVVGAQTRSAVLVLALKPGFAILASADGVVLERGMRGPEVRELKRWLAAAGYDPGTATNRYDRPTVRAARAFQEATPGLAVSGKTGLATRLALARAIHLVWPGTCG